MNRMSDREDGRAWCACIQYPGLRDVYFGTVYVRLGAGEMEVEAAARKQALEHLPDGFAVVRLVPGSVVFIPEEK